MNTLVLKTSLCALTLVLIAPKLVAQDRLASMPGFQNFQNKPRELRAGFKSGSINVAWSEDGKSCSYTRDGKRFTLDLASGKETEVGGPTRESLTAEFNEEDAEAQDRGQAPRGRQFPREFSPDGKWRSTYQDRNLWIGPRNGDPTIQVTTDGTDASRVKSGTATWVMGEELGQRTAMWWSPDSKKLAFYRIDESKVPDYFLTTRAGGFQNGLYVEPYAKAGAINPVVDVLVYDLESKKITKIDVRSGRGDDEGVGHYVYAVEWSADSKDLQFYRTNRLQNEMEWVAADPNTGSCRVLMNEKWPTWVANHPPKSWLSDRKRLLWGTERNGYLNYLMIDGQGKVLSTVTNQKAEVRQIVRVDEKNNKLYYMAGTGVNPHMIQLHVVGLDGKGDRRLTDPNFSHRVSLSPSGEYFSTVSQTVTDPPETSIVRVKDAKVIKSIAKSDLKGFLAAGGQPVRKIEFTAADGKTKLFSRLHLPSNFDPNKKYPMIVDTYNGPESSMYSESFGLPSDLTELGFLVAQIETRGGSGRGKAFQDEMYLKCGITEIDDLAAGVMHIGVSNSFVDSNRVGIEGTSYGGYSSIMCILRYPDVFHAACASSSVTDWRHYDTIYTERYMATLKENLDGYNAGSAMTYAKDLKGWLLMFYGTMDDNVHPANTLQLVTALNRAGKSYELQIGPDAGHAGVNFQRQLEFFIERLILSPSKPGKP